MRALLLGVLLVSRAVAQDASLLPGAYVRLTAPSDGMRNVRGTVTAVRGDSVLLVSDAHAPFAARRAAITRADVYQGRSHGLGAWRGALIAGAIGASLGALMDPPTPTCSTKTSPCEPLSKRDMIVLNTYAFGLLGEWIGAWRGADRWATAARPATTPTVASRPEGARLFNVQRGVAVRVDAPGVLAPNLEGVVLESARDSLVIATARGVQLVVPTASVRTVLVKQPSRREGARRGALWGLAIFGPVAPFAAEGAPTSTGVTLEILEATVVYMGVGALVNMSRGEEWVAVGTRAAPPE